MRLHKGHAELAVIALFAGLVALVFQQIATDMTEQGIASGGPYDNAASYPRAVAILAGAATLAATLGPIRGWRDRVRGDGLALADLRRPAILLAVFALYLAGLGTLGYLVSTPPMVAAIMALGGMRSAVRLTLFPVVLTVALSWIFQVLLSVVLPRGDWGLAIPW